MKMRFLKINNHSKFSMNKMLLPIKNIHVMHKVISFSLNGNDNFQINSQRLNTTHDAINIFDILDSKVCSQLIERGTTGFSPIYKGQSSERKHDQFIFEDHDLKRDIFDKIQPYLDPTFIDTDGSKWELSDIRSDLRLNRYGENEYFKPHYDGAFTKRSGNEIQKSFFTLIIYLNDVPLECGGRTNFVTEESLSITASAIPKKGSCLIFDQRLRHEGEQLKSTAKFPDVKKFIIRGDILYKYELSDSLLEAVNMNKKAQELDSNGLTQDAIILYKKSSIMADKLGVDLNNYID